MITLFVQIVAGVRGISPAGPARNWLALVTNVVAVLGAVVAVSLTAMGARNALRADETASGPRAVV